VIVDCLVKRDLREILDLLVDQENQVHPD